MSKTLLAGNDLLHPEKWASGITYAYNSEVNHLKPNTMNYISMKQRFAGHPLCQQANKKLLQTSTQFVICPCPQTRMDKLKILVSNWFNWLEQARPEIGGKLAANRILLRKTFLQQTQDKNKSDFIAPHV